MKERKRKADDLSKISSLGKSLMNMNSPNNDTENSKKGHQDVLYQGHDQMGVVIKSGQRTSPRTTSDDEQHNEEDNLMFSS